MSSLPPPTRWVGAGTSTLDGSAAAARQAAEQALLGPDPCLVVIFASARHDLAAVAAGVREVAPAAALAGCTTAGEIAVAGGADAAAAAQLQDRGVTVMMFGGDGFTVHLAAAAGLAEHPYAAGERLGRSLTEAAEQSADRPHQVLLLLTDGLAGDQQALVTGVYRATGAAVPLVGGCAGDDLGMRRTHQLVSGPDGDRVLTDAAVGVWLGSDAPLGIGVRHGWRRVGAPLVVTAAEGGHVLALDDEPALDMYLQRAGAPAAAGQDTEAFTRFSLVHPLGLGSRSQDLVRFVMGADLEARALHLVTPVPEGALVWIMAGDAGSVLEATDAACLSALSQLSGLPARGLLAFDCIARREVLGSGTRQEVERIAAHGGGAPVAGFYTYGEIARTQGIRGFHSQTLVVLAVA